MKKGQASPVDNAGDCSSFSGMTYALSLVENAMNESGLKLLFRNTSNV